MFKRLVVLFILGITSTLTLAQDFSRTYTVRDSETNNFISGATVSIIDTVNNETFASGVTDNRGQITLNWTIVSNEDEFEIPKDLQVSNVFPNPVVNEANIDLSVSENDVIEVEIFNLLGQRVGTYNQALNAGGYKLLFKVNGLANGTYFARITHNDQVKLRKFSYIGGGQGGISFNGLNRSDFGRFKRPNSTQNIIEGVIVKVEKEGFETYLADFQETGSDQLDISLNPIMRQNITLNFIIKEDYTFTPGDIQLIVVEGAEFSEEDEIDALLLNNNIPLTLKFNPDDLTQLMFVIPESEPGDEIIALTFFDQVYELGFQIGETKLIEEPRAFTTHFFDSLNTRLTAIIEDVEEDEFQNQVDSLRLNIQQASDTLETMTDPEVALLARILSRFIEENERDFNSKVFIGNSDITQCVSPEEIIDGDLSEVLNYQSALNISSVLAENAWGGSVASALFNTSEVLKITIIEDAKNKMDYFFSSCLALDQSAGSLGIADENLNLSTLDNRFKLRENVTYTYYIANRYNTPFTLLQKLNQLDSYLEEEGVLLPELWREILFPDNGFVFVTRDLENVIIEENNFQFDVDIVKGDSTFTVTFEHTHDFFKFDSEQNISITATDTVTGRRATGLASIKPGLTVKFRDDSITFKPGELRFLDITGILPGVDSLKSIYDAVISESIPSAIFYTEEEENSLLFSVPEIEPGEHTLVFNLEGQSITMNFIIDDYAVIENPSEFLDIRLDELIQDIQASLGSETDPKTITLLNDVLSRFEEFRSGTSSISESEIRYLARIFMNTVGNVTSSQIPI
jgi:hypothetical protein